MTVIVGLDYSKAGIILVDPVARCTFHQLERFTVDLEVILRVVGSGVRQAGLELVEGDLGGHAGRGKCLGGTAAPYDKGRAATTIVGLERGQHLSGGARISWPFFDFVLNIQNNTPVFCEAGDQGRCFFPPKNREQRSVFFSALNCVDVRNSN